jgi:hypothetical protein
VGVDLTVIFDKYEIPGPMLAYNRLGFKGRHSDLWAMLVEASTPAPCDVEWYGDSGIERTTTNPYGDPIRCLTAGEFARVWYWHSGQSGAQWGAWDLAIVAFVQALPLNTMLYLWFH